jgi:hypothetical protein
MKSLNLETTIHHQRISSMKTHRKNALRGYLAPNVSYGRNFGEFHFIQILNRS